MINGSVLLVPPVKVPTAVPYTLTVVPVTPTSPKESLLIDKRSSTAPPTPTSTVKVAPLKLTVSTSVKVAAASTITAAPPPVADKAILGKPITAASFTAATVTSMV